MEKIKENKGRRRRGIGISKKTAIGIFVVMIAATLIASAGTLLTYFGQIETTAEVEQAVVISDGTGWKNWDQPITHTIPEFAPGGETFCYEQWIWNRASIPVEVSLDTNSYDGITTTYSIPAVYAYEKNIPGKDGGLPDLNVKVEDTGDWLLWTYTGDGTTRPTPKMSVSIDYPTGFSITTFDDGSHDGWYYAPDGGSEVYLGAYAGYDGSASGYEWVQTTASGNVMTVKILKAHLGDSFKWHGYGNFYNGQCWINDQETGTGYEVNQFVVNLWQPTTGFTLLSDEVLQFRICYAFDLHIPPDTYILTTEVDATATP